MMETREVAATFQNGEVTVPSKEETNMLLQSGYGTLMKDKTAALSRCEALYLVAEKRMKVLEGADEVEVPFQSLLDRFKVEDSEVWTRYLIFRDLRSRGYVVKDGIGLGIDFRVYERGQYHTKAAKYVVFAISEGSPIPANRLGEILKLVHGMKRELIVAVMDRRGEIVYYSLSWLNLDLRSKSGE
ncbi:MAG: tRNA-intron lyase [Candidatus Bathyarchaeota archaeon]